MTTAEERAGEYAQAYGGSLDLTAFRLAYLAGYKAALKDAAKAQCVHCSRGVPIHEGKHRIVTSDWDDGLPEWACSASAICALHPGKQGE